MDEFRNANALAHAVNDNLGAPFTPRPFNRYSPEETFWWLVPSTDWPAFKWGKLFFDSREDRIPGKKQGIFCGFEVEKGLSRRLRVFYNQDLIEGSDWLWEQFTERITAEYPALHPPQFISIGLSYIPIEKARYIGSAESFLAQRESFEACRSFFNIDVNQKLRLLKLTANENSREIAEHCQTKVRTAKNLKSLLANLREFPYSDWSWLSLCIGTVVTRGTIAKLWNDYLKPWSPWLGTSRSAYRAKA